MKVAKDSEQGKRPTAGDFRRGSEVFKALSNPNRLLLLDAMRDGEMGVGELTARVGLDISTVSNHLAVLRGVGMVADERRGTQVFYRINNPCVLKIFNCLAEFDSRAGHDFSQLNETPNDDEEPE